MFLRVFARRHGSDVCGSLEHAEKHMRVVLEGLELSNK